MRSCVFIPKHIEIEKTLTKGGICFTDRKSVV